MAKLNWLEEVKADAEYNTRKRIREYQEDNAFKTSKNKPEVEESEYTETVTAKGAVQYRRNGKLISKEDYENRG